MYYELQLWTGTSYHRHTQSPNPDELRRTYRDNFHGGYRIVDADKHRTLTPKRKDMNWGSVTNRRRQDDGISEWQQAQAAATHYHKLRTRDLQDHRDPSILTKVPVFPVKPSGRGTASEYRGMLAGLLTGQIRPTIDRYWGNTIDSTRKLIERNLADHGFEFVEVDVEDYS